MKVGEVKIKFRAPICSSSALRASKAYIEKQEALKSVYV
jgi:hypothetical protein